MNQKQRRVRKKAVKAHQKRHAQYNQEHPDEVEARRNIQEAEAKNRHKAIERVKKNKEKRENKRKKKNVKSPNLKEVNMWGIKVPIYVTPEKEKMFRKKEGENNGN